jgi:hypothetical protein
MEIILIMGLAGAHEACLEEESFSKVAVTRVDLTLSVDGPYSLTPSLPFELFDRGVGVVRLAVTLGALTFCNVQKLSVGVMLASLL